MFIRSQNEQVIKILNNAVWYLPAKDAYGNMVYHIMVDGHTFGDYSSQQQAYKVLDDIFNALKSNDISFEMPKNQEYDVEVVVDETNKS